MVFAFTGHAATNYVSIEDSTYVPADLAINVGDTVTWTQNDFTTEHTVTSDDLIFDSDTLFFMDVYSFVFAQEGKYPYFCVFHGHGMSGSVVVSQGAPNTPPATPTNVRPTSESPQRMAWSRKVNG